MDGVLKHMKSFGLSQEDPQVQKCGGENEIHADPGLPEQTAIKPMYMCLSVSASSFHSCLYSLGCSTSQLQFSTSHRVNRSTR